MSHTSLVCLTIARVSTERELNASVSEQFRMARFVFIVMPLGLLLFVNSKAHSCESRTDCKHGFRSCCRGICTVRRSCDNSCAVNEDCNIADSEICISGHCERQNFDETITDTPTHAQPCLLGPGCGTEGVVKRVQAKNITNHTAKDISYFMPKKQFLKGTETPVTTTSVTKNVRSTEKSVLQEDFIIAFVGLSLLILNVIVVSYCISRASAKRSQRDLTHEQSEQNPSNSEATRNRAFVIDLEPEGGQEQQENLPPYDFSAVYQATECRCSNVESVSSGTIVQICGAPPPYSNTAAAPLYSNVSSQSQGPRLPSNAAENTDCGSSDGRADSDTEEPPSYRSISTERLDILPPSYEETLRKPDNYCEVTTGL